MLPYLEIMHTESHCHVGLCLIMPNILWKLFGLDVPNVMSEEVDGKKLTLGTSCWRERVNSIVVVSPLSEGRQKTSLSRIQIQWKSCNQLSSLNSSGGDTVVVTRNLSLQDCTDAVAVTCAA